ncbi:molybdate ABC transporter substrate-binding protein [Nakamurella aerolata]|uniref:molybdate ABC transporter substrate-binding protein n=1 Tax=Nakamurella aerolata TaxID=1656892 RepID=UPI001BB15380
MTAGILLVGCAGSGDAASGESPTATAGASSTATAGHAATSGATDTASGATGSAAGSAVGSGGSAGGSAGSAGGSGGSAKAAPGGAAAVSGVVTVYAAASLTASFTELAKTFEQQHKGASVRLSFDGSSTLVTQLRGGAPADVFASADEKNMAKATDAGLAGDPVAFASNTLQIAVAPGNPKKITGLKDLASSELTTVLCAPEVPCGSAAGAAEKAAGVDIRPVSEEQNVTAVLTKIETGEADAGLVYKTDVSSAGGKVAGVDFPQAAAAVNTYPIVALNDAPNPAGAAAFVELVTSAQGQNVLARYGFGKP